MNKSIKLLAFTFLALLFSVGAGARTLKIATIVPDGTVWMNEMKAGADNVAQRTDNRVKLKFFGGGVMGNDQSVHSKIKLGQLHGGAFTQAGLGRVNDSIQALGLPMMFRSFEEVDYVRERLDPILKREMESSGFVLLGISEGGFARILSTKPMVNLEALRASKVWVPEGDKVGLTAFRGLGITPISLPIADVFTGLQTGLIETVPTNPASAIAFQWHSSTEYMTDVPITYIVGLLAVSKKVFDKLSADDQAVLREEMGAVFKRLDKINRDDNQAAMQALQQQGIRFVEPEPGEVERWREIADKSVDEMVASKVVSPEIVKQVREYVQQFRAGQ